MKNHINLERKFISVSRKLSGKIVTVEQKIHFKKQRSRRGRFLVFHMMLDLTEWQEKVWILSELLKPLLTPT